MSVTFSLTVPKLELVDAKHSPEFKKALARHQSNELEAKENDGNEKQLHSQVNPRTSPKVKSHKSSHNRDKKKHIKKKKLLFPEYEETNAVSIRIYTYIFF